MESDNVTVVKVEYPRVNVKVPDYWAEKGKRLIDESYGKINSVEDICTTLHISPSYFLEAFYESFGVSPKIYLTRVKIEQAKILLRKHGAVVHEVAVLVGYRQTVTFEKAFKKVVGVPPSKYRGEIE